MHTFKIKCLMTHPHSSSFFFSWFDFQLVPLSSLSLNRKDISFGQRNKYSIGAEKHVPRECQLQTVKTAKSLCTFLWASRRCWKGEHTNCRKLTSYSEHLNVFCQCWVMWPLCTEYILNLLKDIALSAAYVHPPGCLPSGPKQRGKGGQWGLCPSAASRGLGWRVTRISSQVESHIKTLLLLLLLSRFSRARLCATP